MGQRPVNFSLKVRVNVHSCKADAFSGQNYFPEKMGRQQFYDPPERGFEREIKKRLDWWSKLRRERGGG